MRLERIYLLLVATVGLDLFAFEYIVALILLLNNKAVMLREYGCHCLGLRTNSIQLPATIT